MNSLRKMRAFSTRAFSTSMLCFVAALVAAASNAADVLVVCPAELRTALGPWESYRESQGHTLLVIDPPATAAELRTTIRNLAKQNQLQYVVLVGDVRHARSDVSVVPTAYAKAQINVRWGSEPTIATDQLYADLDDDSIPDVAVGRIPAHSPSELSAVVRKILRYEQQADEGMWRRHVDIVAGVGGFGAVTDALVEAAGRSVIRETVPASYDVTPTFASSVNPASPPPDQFTAYVCRQLSAGSFAWIYLGHGLPTALDSIHTSAGDQPILSTADLPQLKCGANSPLAVLIACYTGAIDARSGCLAGDLALDEAGPVAVIAATRVTMPYGNAVFGCELLRACFNDRPSTLGELWKSAQRRTLAGTPDDSLRKSLDALASGLSPPPVDLAAECREHVLMYQLYGDPLLRLQYPHDLELSTSSDAAAGKALTVNGQSDVAGDCTIELVADRGSSSSLATAATTTLPVTPGPFHAALSLPQDTVGQYTIRAFVAGRSEFALGATSVKVRQESATAIWRATSGPAIK
jgi:hypothetical protein